MRRSLYHVLEIPSSATRTEIRAAYRRQLTRIRLGELSSSLRPLIERACVTLDDPDRRIHYDVTIARRSRLGRMDHGDARRSSNQFITNAVTSGAALAAALAIILLAATAMRSRRSAPVQARPVLIPTAAAPVIDPAPQPPTDLPQAVPAIAVLPDSSSSAESAPATIESPPAVAFTPPQAVSSALPTEARRALPPEPVSARPADSTLAGSAGPNPADDGASVDPSPAQSADPSAAPAIIAGTDPSPSAPALVQSSSFGRVAANGNSRADSHVQGWFCRDTTGGEVFVPAGAPLPAGVACQ
jgi:hypothetical protein